MADKDLAVADMAGLCRLLDDFHGLFDHLVSQYDLDLDLGDKVYDVLRTPVEFGMSLLPAEALHLGHGHSLYPDGRQGVLDFVEPEGFDDGLKLLHRSPVLPHPYSASVNTRRAWTSPCSPY